MSLNLAVFEGRIVKDIEIKEGKNNNHFGLYTIAVQQNFKNKEGKYGADFINCFSTIRSDKQLEFLKKAIQKGKRVIVKGEMRQNIFETKEGEKRSYLNLLVQNIYLVDTLEKDYSSEKNDEANHTEDILIEESIEVPNYYQPDFDNHSSLPFLS